VRVAEALVMNGTALSIHHAKCLIVDAMVFDDLAVYGWSFDTSDGFFLGEDAINRMNTYVALVDSAFMGAEQTNSFNVTIRVEESFYMDATQSSIGQFIIAIEEGFQMAAVLRLMDGEYNAWVIGPKNRAVSRYTNFGFNSMVEFNDTYYGMMDDGLYEIGGSTDAGANIKAYVKSGLINFGSSLMKRMSKAYLYYSATGDMVIKVTATTDAGVRETHWYRMTSKATGDAATGNRVPVGQGFVSINYQFEITNLAGADFNVDGMKMLPIYMTRRI
jgi:hypothetical protein